MQAKLYMSEAQMPPRGYGFEACVQYHVIPIWIRKECWDRIHFTREKAEVQRLARGFHQESMGKLCPEPVPGSLLPVILPHGWSEAEGDPRGGMGRRHISGGWAPPQVDLSRQQRTAALSCRMLRVILQKRPQARERVLPGGQRREGQRELGPFDDHLCHPSSSPAPLTLHAAYSRQQSQWLWRQPKDSHSSPYHDRLGRGRQKLLGFPKVSHFTRDWPVPSLLPQLLPPVPLLTGAQNLSLKQGI